ncbi:uncharacterized protein LOC121736970 [Aricia agestis]|uniref:uncharacterized protein LOC121736970 n=1 Tax=Aricia agestis TaxID=91739 RepID=UPI001C20668E|nr:uncharacterized protein LOC121736970 [Aricia agestis]XP_041984394.1 uncharacterized protein LOC121736970 [Aricia agestis]XP_041984395.1 uncharacterized protein LOC121736970 [Aricia agestis]XP_041984396.1 uncharacterized protein LOC121736970 [Aricia agestis]
MELVSLGLGVLHDAAERAASYRGGQTVLRYLDRALWCVEKSARWAVPPPLDVDERPQPELVRPLPWVLFLALLLLLRVLRETLSLLNLALGKPPVRSADVVTYIQSKRRYVRALKYRGGRAMRARGPWSLRALLDLALCGRARPPADHTELVIVDKKNSCEAPAAEAGAESSMERLIEKMMVDLDADSDDDHSYTLTNVTSVRSDKSDYSDSEHEIAFNKDSKPSGTIEDETGTFSKPNNMATSTPEKNHIQDIGTEYSTIKSENNNSVEATAMFLQHENCTYKKVVANGKSKTGIKKESTREADLRQ